MAEDGRGGKVHGCCWFHSVRRVAITQFRSLQLFSCLVLCGAGHRVSSVSHALTNKELWLSVVLVAHGICPAENLHS